MTNFASDSLIAAYQKIDTSTIGHLTEQGYLVGIKPIQDCNQGLAGRVVTVRLNSDNTDMINEALRLAQPKDVLCIGAQILGNKACWGALRTCAAIFEQLTAVIVLGKVTDSKALKQLGFPVFASGISALTTHKSIAEQGEINCCLKYQTDDNNTVTINSGDVAVMDNDGVFILPLPLAESLIKDCQQKQQKDDAKLELFMDAYQNNELDQIVKKLKAGKYN